MYKKGTRRGVEGVTSCTPIKIFEKLPHKNPIKHDPPDFSQPQLPPLKRICQKKNKDPLLPWISNYCASMQ
jgi:hypothetical protein